MLEKTAVKLRDLQVAQRCAARLITELIMRDRIAPVLSSLHWLLAHQRVEQKVLNTLHIKTLNNEDMSVYLRDRGGQMCGEEDSLGEWLSCLTFKTCLADVEYLPVGEADLNQSTPQCEHLSGSLVHVDNKNIIVAC